MPPLIAEDIHNIREDMGMSIGEFAHRLGYTPNGFAKAINASPLSKRFVLCVIAVYQMHLARVNAAHKRNEQNAFVRMQRLCNYVDQP